MSDQLKISSTQESGYQKINNHNKAAARNTSEASFAEILNATNNSVKFSNHAQKRLQTRNINLTEDGLTRLASAIDKADQHGGKESLVLVDDLAFIINVKDRLVVTAMDNNNRGEGVFTKIDSVVIADKINAYKNENQ